MEGNNWQPWTMQPQAKSATRFDNLTFIIPGLSFCLENIMSSAYADDFRILAKYQADF